MKWFLTGLGLFLIGSSILGVFLIRRRKRMEELFTLYSSAGRWEDALPFARVLAALHGPAEVRFRRRQNLGVLLARLERLDEARDALEDALEVELDPGSQLRGTALVNLAFLELRAGRLASARSWAARLAAEGPDELRPRARTLEAGVLVKEGKPAEARALLEPQVAELRASRKPTDATALVVLAAALRASGSSEEAATLVTLVRERLPELQRKELAATFPELPGVL